MSSAPNLKYMYYLDNNFLKSYEDINIQDKEIYNLKTELTDLTQSPSLDAYYKDQSCVLNKEFIS